LQHVSIYVGENGDIKDHIYTATGRVAIGLQRHKPFEQGIKKIHNC